jgi:hypothetical protein
LTRKSYTSAPIGLELSTQIRRRGDGRLGVGPAPHTGLV